MAPYALETGKGYERRLVLEYLRSVAQTSELNGERRMCITET